MNTFKTQVEVQGTKKLDSVKGVEVLTTRELKEIEGGAFPWLFLAGVAAGYYLGEAIDSFIEGFERGTTTEKTDKLF